MNSHWHQKTVLITGAASGIGKALATDMIRRGAIVWLADLNPAVQAVAQSLGENARHLVFDVADFSSWQDAVSQVLARDSQLDFLFNNAGIGFGCDAVDLTHAHYERYIDVNLRSVTHSTALVYPLMVKQGHGTIVNTASMGGLIPSPLMAPYAMTKHAVVGLSESLRLEARSKGVRVITLCPGSVNTPMFDATGIAGLPVRKATDLRAYTREADTSCTPEHFARNALDDIEKNRTLIMYPKLMRIIVWIYRHFPALFALLQAPNLDKELKRLHSGS